MKPDNNIDHVDFVDSLHISMRKYDDFSLYKGLFPPYKEIRYKRSEKYDNEKHSFLISQMLDIDEWKHTWHLDVQDDNQIDRMIEIIQGKIDGRDQEIRMLFEALYRLYERKKDQDLNR